MAISHLCGFEMGHEAEAFQVNGSIIVSTAIVRTGTYALIAQPVSAQGYVRFRSRAAGGTFRSQYMSASFYMQIQTMPSGDTVIAGVFTAAGGNQHRLQLRSSGVLRLLDSVGNVVATSTNVLTADAKWHRIDFDCAYNAGAGMRVSVDNTVWASNTATVVTADVMFILGVFTATTAAIAFDDVAMHDASIGTMNHYRIGLLRPNADQQTGAWLNSSGFAAQYGEFALPPSGNVANDGTGNRIKNLTSSASSTQDYRGTCPSYRSLVGDSTILAVQAIVNDAQQSTTASPKAGAIFIWSEPSQAEQSFDFGIPYGLNGTNSAGGMGTFPAQWGTHTGVVTENPDVDRNALPIVAVGKRTATTQEVDVDFIGIYVMWSIVSFTEDVEMTDTIVVEVGKAVSITDSLGVSSSITTTGGADTIQRIITDAVGVQDDVLGQVFAEYERVGITDSLVVSGVLARTITDSVGMTDTVAALRDKGITENVGLTDSIDVDSTSSVLTRTIDRVLQTYTG